MKLWNEIYKLQYQFEIPIIEYFNANEFWGTNYGEFIFKLQNGMGFDFFYDIFHYIILSYRKFQY